MDVIGNVKDEFVKPPNYSGPVMVGHLMFDADFESGNLGRIEYSADNEYDLFIRVDTCNQKYRLWVRLNFILDCEGTKVGCAFPMVIWSESSVRQHRDDDHRKTHSTLSKQSCTEIS